MRALRVGTPSFSASKPMHDSPTIAVILLTYNEAIHLPRALASLADFATQVFVVDSYSTDNTVELAARAGAHVVQRPFKNQSDQFGWALENLPIQSDWVMRLDADEIIEPALAEEIRRRLNLLPADVTGINLKRKTIFQGKFIRFGGRYPLLLLRIWRTGKARIEERWMDEHIYLTGGRSITFQSSFADHNLYDLTAFTEKHNRYASREAVAVLSERLGLLENRSVVLSNSRTRTKRFFKEKFYDRIPFEISACAYFLYRYIVRLGFLDGQRGLVYHFLQGFWYRFLVGAKLKELELAVRTLTTREEKLAAIERLTRLEIS